MARSALADTEDRKITAAEVAIADEAAVLQQNFEVSTTVVIAASAN